MNDCMTIKTKNFTLFDFFHDAFFAPSIMGRSTQIYIFLGRIEMMKSQCSGMRLLTIFTFTFKCWFELLKPVVDFSLSLLHFFDCVSFVICIPLSAGCSNLIGVCFSPLFCRHMEYICLQKVKRLWNWWVRTVLPRLQSVKSRLLTTIRASNPNGICSPTLVAPMSPLIPASERLIASSISVSHGMLLRVIWFWWGPNYFLQTPRHEIFPTKKPTFFWSASRVCTVYLRSRSFLGDYQYTEHSRRASVRPWP